MNNIRNKRVRLSGMILLILSTALFSACSTARRIGEVIRPEASVQSVEIRNLTFQSVDLIFNVGIRNPNNVSARINRLDYTLYLNDRQFLQGDRKEAVTILGNSTTVVDIPLTLRYDAIYSAFRALSGQDSVPYRAEIGLYVELPVLGNVRIPVTQRGYLPLVQAPRINIDAVQIKSLRITGADLMLNVLLDNPNGFSLLMRRLTYEFLVSNQSWAAGTVREEVQIAPNSRSTFGIPVAVNFLSVGQSVYRLLTDSKALNYRFQGNILFGTSNPLIKEINFPFDITGNAEVKR